MRTYGQRYCPVARASEVFAERWTPIIVRNLLLGCSTFSEILEGAPGLSRSVLTQRLRELERLGVLTKEASRYCLTPAGRELQPVCEALGTWGARWLESAAPRELDPGIVLWAVAKCMNRNALPEQRVVVRFDLRRPRMRFWLLVAQPEPELCRTHPGADEDLVVVTDGATLARWHMGELSLRQARSAGDLEVAGPPRLVREFARWGGQSPFADVPRGERVGSRPHDGDERARGGSRAPVPSSAGRRARREARLSAGPRR
jgi:DNA-binding HxlR family transcriptional regulator